MATPDRADVYARITAEIVAAIEAGAGEYAMRWHHDGTATARPVNITFTGRKQYNHSSYEGGDLIATAATHRESGLAKATVDTHEQLVPAKGGRLFAGASGEPSHRTRELRRGGAA